MADGGVYVNSNGDWVRAGGAGGGGGIDVESEREHQLLQGDDAKGWVPGMAMSVVDAVPDDSVGEIGDVVFVTGPGDGSPAPTTPDPGLVYLGGQTFSGEPEVIFDGVFSSKYDSYRIHGNISASKADEVLRYKLRSNGVNSEGATDYRGAAYYSDMNGTLDGSSMQTTGSASGAIGAVSTGMGAFEATLLSTQEAGVNDCMLGRSVTSGSGTVKTHVASFACYSNAAHDGIRLFVPNATFSGTIQIYGYSKGA